MASRAKQIAIHLLKKVNENYRLLNRPDFHSARIIIRVLPNGNLFVGFSPSQEEEIEPKQNTVDMEREKK